MTEWVVDLQAQALSLASSDPRHEALARVQHEDTPAARAAARQQARARLVEQVPTLEKKKK